MRIRTKSYKALPPLPAFFPCLVLFPISLPSSASAATGRWENGVMVSSLYVFSAVDAVQFFLLS